MKNFEKYVGKVIYFLGIGGVSMSALAKLSLRLGCVVLGSNDGETIYMRDLDKLGILAYNTHSVSHIDSTIDYIVCTGAVSKDNVEYVEAQKLGIPIVSRGEYLGDMCCYYHDTIAISGTHGKTTTTAMISYILELARANPTMHLGGERADIVDNVVIGSRDTLVTEACEYKDSFSSIRSKISVITNIEKEHMDYYHSIDEIISSYDRFVSNSDISVVWVDSNTVKLKGKCIYTCGLDLSLDFSIKNIKRLKVGYIFDVYYRGLFLYRFQNCLIGIHNVYNSLLSIATCYLYGVDLPYIYMGILSFRGVRRRYEYVGEYKDIPCIIDYAHHPTEIRSSVCGIRDSYRHVLCIFQPHTYSRTLTLMSDFKSCFLGADTLCIYRTYPAREKSIKGGRAIDLFDLVKNKDKNYISSKAKLKEYLSSISTQDYDCILVLGAGTIADIFVDIIKKA